MNTNAKDCNANWVVVSNRELCQKVPASDLYESRVSQVNTALWVRVTLLAAECDSEAKFRRRYKQSAEFTQTHTHKTQRTLAHALFCRVLSVPCSASFSALPLQIGPAYRPSTPHSSTSPHSLVCIRKGTELIPPHVFGGSRRGC